MRSALYYPHTEIRSDSLWKSALLLWDSIGTIVPAPHYTPHYENKEHAAAHDLIGKSIYPSEEAQTKAHGFVEDFVTRKLPAAFSFSSTKEGREIYEIYPQKFLPETFGLLIDAGLSDVQLPNADYPMAAPTGLTLMSIIADCCAGTTRCRVTDLETAYAGIANLLATPLTESEPDDQSSKETLIAVSLDVLDITDVSIAQLIEFRERERSEAKGHDYRDLRHRYFDRLAGQATALAKALTPEEQNDIRSDFRQTMSDDVKSLRDGLRTKAVQTLYSKEMVTSVIAGVSALSPHLGMGVIPMPDVVSVTGCSVTIGGLLAAKSKYAESRKALLQSHPMAYLYEMRGGIRW